MKEKIKEKLPEISRDIKEFISDESGFVSKDKILKAGFALGIASLLMANNVSAATTHTNTLSGSMAGNTLTGTHTHHGSHSNY